MFFVNIREECFKADSRERADNIFQLARISILLFVVVAGDINRNAVFHSKFNL
jgi:hypothetical protein